VVDPFVLHEIDQLRHIAAHWGAHRGGGRGEVLAEVSEWLRKVVQGCYRVTRLRRACSGIASAVVARGFRASQPACAVDLGALHRADGPVDSFFPDLAPLSTEIDVRLEPGIS
jgi:hypothetical protein